MPIIYLSPSTQEWQPLCHRQRQRGVQHEPAGGRHGAVSAVQRHPATAATTPDMTRRRPPSGRPTAADYDFYLALHSNAAGQGAAQPRPGHHRLLLSRQRRAGSGRAELIAKNLREIYPLPDKVTHPLHHHPGRGAPAPVPGGAGGDRLPRQLQPTPLWVEGHRGGHRPAAGPGPDGVLRPALHLAHGPDAAARCTLSYGTLNLRSTAHPPPATVMANLPNGARGDGLRRVAGLVCGALRGSGGICRSSLYRQLITGEKRPGCEGTS